MRPAPPSRPTRSEQQACVARGRATATASTGATTRCTTRRRRAPTPPTRTAPARTLRVPRDGRRAQPRRPARGDGRRLQPHAGRRPGPEVGARPDRARLLPPARPATGAVETSTCCAEHRDRAPDDGEADGRLGRDLGARVQGRRLPLRPHGPPPEGATCSTLRRALDALTLGRDGVDGKRDLPLRRGLELRRGRRQRPLRAGDASSTWRAPASARSTTGCATPSAAAARSTPTRASRASPPACSPTRTAPPSTARRTSSARGCCTTRTRSRSGWPATCATTAFVDRTGADRHGRGGRLQRPARRLRRRPERDDHLRRRARQRDAVRRAAVQAAAGHVDGRPGADEHASRWRPTALAPGPVVLARRHRPAALQVARPQLLQLGRLVQPDRLDRAGLHLGLRACRRARDNEAKWAYMRPLLADPALEAVAGGHPRRARDRAARAAAHPLLVAAVPARQRARDPASASASPTGGPDQTPGVIVMAIDGRRDAGHRRGLQRDAAPDHADRRRGWPGAVTRCTPCRPAAATRWCGRSAYDRRDGPSPCRRAPSRSSWRGARPRRRPAAPSAAASGGRR